MMADLSVSANTEFPNQCLSDRAQHFYKSVMKNENETVRLIRLPEVISMVGLSRSQIYRDIYRKQFPQPVKIGESAVAWSSKEIQAWIAEKLAGRK